MLSTAALLALLQGGTPPASVYVNVLKRAKDTSMRLTDYYTLPRR